MSDGNSGKFTIGTREYGWLAWPGGKIVIDMGGAAFLHIDGPFDQARAELAVSAYWEGYESGKNAGKHILRNDLWNLLGFESHVPHPGGLS